MRAAPLCLVLLVCGVMTAEAGHAEERARRREAVERYYGPLLPTPSATEQIVVERGLRRLFEDDFYGLFEPVFATRRLPSRIRRLPVEAEHPWYEPPPVRYRRGRVLTK